MTTTKIPKVYEAINLVSASLASSGIGKNNKNQQQRYNFRGIDDVLNALAPKLAEHKLIITPVTKERQVTERVTKNGGNLFYVTILVDYIFTSAIDGSQHTVTVYGEAMDSADKATNKALSAAYKYAMIQTFCIPVEGIHDADYVSYDVAANTTHIIKDIQAAAQMDNLEWIDNHKQEIRANWKALDGQTKNKLTQIAAG